MDSDYGKHLNHGWRLFCKSSKGEDCWETGVWVIWKMHDLNVMYLRNAWVKCYMTCVRDRYALYAYI